MTEGRGGIASGINDAVSRLAGVLAIAILSIVMLGAFERHLAQDVAQINLAPQIRSELDGQRIKLTAIGIPEQIDTATRALALCYLGYLGYSCGHAA